MNCMPIVKKLAWREWKLYDTRTVSVQHLTLSTDLFAIPSFICKWVKNSELHQAPSLSLSHSPSHTARYGIYFLCSPLYSS